jgi:hypothetical protein
MAPELSQNLIQHLVEVGVSERFEDGEKMSSLFPAARSGSFMRLAPHSWYAVAASLDDAQLIACIKALTVLERLPNFCAGSVSPVIWLFRKLSERSHADLTAVIDWVLTHTDNPYLPFGTHNLGAQSLEELNSLSVRAAERAEARHATEENCQREFKLRKAAEATHKLFGALRRHDEKAVVALFSQGADIHASNQHGQTAFEYARSLGLEHLITPSPIE